ncbi:hypothetical protein Tco_0549195 [Tanacetum coccineum]
MEEERPSSKLNKGVWVPADDTTKVVVKPSVCVLQNQKREREDSVAKWSISRIKSSSRHEVTIPNPVFRCSEFGGVTDWYQSCNAKTSKETRLAKFRWLAKTLKKGSPFEPDSETNEPPLRTYQRWKKALYEEALRKSDQMHQTFEKSSLAMTHKLDDIIELPQCMSWLGSTDTYDEPLGSLGMMDNEVGNTSPQSTSQIRPSFEEYTPLVTHPKEVDDTLGTPMKEEPLDQTKLEDAGLTNHNISLSSREVPSVDELEPQLLPNCPSLDVSLEDERGPEPPIKLHSPDSFKMKVVDSLTIHTSFHPHVDVFSTPKKYLVIITHV